MGVWARCIVFTLAGAAAFLVVAAGAARADEPERVSSTLDASVRSLGIQTDMPERKGERPGTSRSGGWGGDGFNVSPELARMMLWIAVGVFVLSVLLTLRDNFRLAPPPRQKRAAGDDAVDDVEVRRRMRDAGVRADDLAAAGNYAEAMHVLLLQGLGEMRRRLDTPIATSLTSREILARVPLAPEAGSALSDIIARVEVSYFGDHGVGPDDYARCRESYVMLTGALQRGASS